MRFRVISQYFKFILFSQDSFQHGSQETKCVKKGQIVASKCKNASNEKSRNVYRNYETSNILSAAKKKNPKIQKLGRPYALPDEIEQRIVKYIVNIQELGFGLTVFQVRKLA